MKPPLPDAIYEDVLAQDKDLIVGVPWEDVENLDVTRVEAALRRLLQSRDRVLGFKDRVHLAPAGYEGEESALLHRHDEVRGYLERLDRQFPYWFYFHSKRTNMLTQIALCLCEVKYENGTAFPETRSFQGFLRRHFEALNALCLRFDLGEATKSDVTKAISRYYELENG